MKSERVFFIGEPFNVENHLALVNGVRFCYADQEIYLDSPINDKV